MVREYLSGHDGEAVYTENTQKGKMVIDMRVTRAAAARARWDGRRPCRGRAVAPQMHG